MRFRRRWKNKLNNDDNALRHGILFLLVLRIILLFCAYYTCTEYIIYAYDIIWASSPTPKTRLFAAGREVIRLTYTNYNGL